MENQINIIENQTGSADKVPETSSNKTKTWIYRIICILLFAAGVVFLVYFYGAPILNSWEIIMLGAMAAILAIIWCFFTIRKKVIKFVVLIIAGIMLATGWFIYVRYIPKYFLADACAIVKADPKYASATIEPKYYETPEFSIYYNGNTIVGPNIKACSTFELKDNPFYYWGYLLYVIEDGKVTTWIAFDPATGKYYVFYEPKE